MDIKGHTVHRVLIAPGRRHRGRVLLLLPGRPRQPRLPLHRQRRGRCRDRGRRAREPRRASRKVSIDPQVGVDDAKAAEIVAATGFPAEVADQADRTSIKKLWDVFIKEDATLVEVNPLVRLGDGTLEALDGKVTLDENAEFRHEDHAAFEDKAAADPLEAKAKAKGLNYVKLDGAVGIIGNGAGPGDVAPSTSSPTPVRSTAA